MTDLEKLVESWAREVGLPVSETFGPMVGACPVGDTLTAICRLAMAHAAEEAARIAERSTDRYRCAAAIRERFKAK